MRIGVVGAGTAGCAACLFFTRAGHDVTLFERVAEPAPVGAGILLQPTGMTVLHELGLLDPLLARGARVTRLHGETTRRHTVMDLAYDELKPGLFGLGIHRGVLFQTLFSALECDVRCDVDVEEVRDDTIIEKGGRGHGPFDLVVVADGARSKLREATGLVSRSRSYRWAALWHIGPDLEGRYAGSLSQVYRGTRKFVGFLPMGSLEPGGEPLVSLFWSILRDRLEALYAAGIDAWKHEVRSLTDRADPILERIDDLDQLIFAGYQDVVLRRCHDGNVVFIGDAAHATSPQLGQGANLALMDARALARHAPDLEAFARERRDHNRFYQVASRWLTPLYQSGHTWLGPLRDLFVPLANRIPAFRRQSLAAMVGTKDGWLSSIPIDDVTGYLDG